MADKQRFVQGHQRFLQMHDARWLFRSPMGDTYTLTEQQIEDDPTLRKAFYAEMGNDIAGWTERVNHALHRDENADYDLATGHHALHDPRTWPATSKALVPVLRPEVQRMGAIRRLVRWLFRR